MAVAFNNDLNRSGAPQGADAWIGDIYFAASGSFLLPKSHKSFRLRYDDLFIEVTFGQISDEEDGVIEHPDGKVAVAHIKDVLAPSGAMYTWDEVGMLDDGRRLGLSIFFQTVGADLSSSGRVIHYSYMVG